MSSQLQVLVVDDSKLMRTLITDMLQSDPAINVIGTAKDGIDALYQISALQPDVVTLDVEMPRMTGLEALEHIMREMPLPVVMLSGLNEAEITLKALALGAVDFVVKPSGTISVDLYKVRDELLHKVKVAMFADATKLSPATTPPSVQEHRSTPPLPPPTTTAVKSAMRRLVAIAASTGGPRTLDVLLQNLPGSLPAAILVVQHMPRGFTSSLAERLNTRSDLAVKEAKDGETIAAGQVYIAPAGHHLMLDPSPSPNHVRLLLDDSPPIMRLRPAADLLMTSAAEVYGERCIGVILTGMGSDGTQGIQAIKEYGGYTIAQDRATSVIYGMPRSALNSGFIDQVLPLHEIAPAIVRLVEQDAET